MYPAVGVQHILGDVLGVNAVYRIPNVLPGRHDQGEGEEEGDCGAIVEPENARVYSGVVGLDKPLESSEYLEHGDGSQLCLDWSPPHTLTPVIRRSEDGGNLSLLSSSLTVHSAPHGSCSLCCCCVQDRDQYPDDSGQ